MNPFTRTVPPEPAAPMAGNQAAEGVVISSGKGNSSAVVA